MAKIALVCGAIPTTVCCMELLLTRDLCTRWTGDKTSGNGDDVVTVMANHILVHFRTCESSSTSVGFRMEYEGRDANKGPSTYCHWTGIVARTMNSGPKVLIEVALRVEYTLTWFAIIMHLFEVYFELVIS